MEGGDLSTYSNRVWTVRYVVPEQVVIWFGCFGSVIFGVSQADVAARPRKQVKRAGTEALGPVKRHNHHNNNKIPA